MARSRTWAVIENAGYDGEDVRRTGLPSYQAANTLMHKLYPDDDEREELHVDIAFETEDGFSYDY